jgi:hypothetical protein
VAFPIPGIQFPPFPGLLGPKISFGRIVAPAAGWNTQAYTDLTGANVAYAKPPALLVVAEPRSGWYTPKQYVAPKISIALPTIDLPPPPTISVPTVTLPAAPAIPAYSVPAVSIPSVVIPGINLPNLGITLPTVSIPRVYPNYQYWYDEVGGIYPFNTDWGFWFLNMNYIRDGIKSVVATILMDLWNTFVQPQIDRVQSAIQGSTGSVANSSGSYQNPATGHTIGYARYGHTGQSGINGAIINAQDGLGTDLSLGTALLNDTFNTFIADLNTKLAALRDSANAAMNSTIANLNQGLDKLRTNVNGALATGQSNLQKALNSMGSSVSAGVNQGLASFRTSLQNALNELIGGTQDTVNAGFAQLAGFSADAYNSIVPQLWAVLGLPTNTLIVPILFQGDVGSFKYFAPVAGVVVHYVAIGQ